MFKSYIMFISRHLAIHGTRWVVLTTLDLRVQVLKHGKTREQIQEHEQENHQHPVHHLGLARETSVYS